MALQSQIDQDIATSMKEGEAARTSVLRLIKNSLKNEQIKLGHELSDEEAFKVVQREAKQRKDSVQQYRDGNRNDLAEAEEHELVIIQTYLPEQMGEAELAIVVDQVISEIGATSQAQMGQVIGAAMQRTAGKAEGGAVAQVVRQKLG